MASSVIECGDELQSTERDLYPSLVESPHDRRRRLRRRRDLRKARLSSNLKLAAVCCAVICLWLYCPSMYKLSQIRQEIGDLQAQCHEWGQKNLQVMADISYASTDDFVRYAARENLGLVDQGTTLYVAGLPETNSEPTTVRTRRENQPLAMNAPGTH